MVVAVFRFGWEAVAKDNHGGHGIGALEVGVVKALNMLRELRQGEGLLKLDEHFVADRLLCGFANEEAGAFLEVFAKEFSVFGAEVEQLLFIAGFGDGDFERSLGNEYGQRHDDFCGYALVLFAEAGYGKGEDVGIFLIQLALNIHGACIDDGAVTDHHVVDEGVALFGEDAGYVEVAEGGVYDGAFGLKLREGVNLLLEDSGFFKLHVGGPLGHLRFEVAHHFCGVTL